MIIQEGTGLDLCNMMDGPVFLEAVLVEFALWAALVIIAVRFSRSANWPSRRVLVGIILVLSVWASLMTYNSGITADRELRHSVRRQSDVRDLDWPQSAPRRRRARFGTTLAARLMRIE
jgi:hypothetical protein